MVFLRDTVFREEESYSTLVLVGVNLLGKNFQNRNRGGVKRQHRSHLRFATYPFHTIRNSGKFCVLFRFRSRAYLVLAKAVELCKIVRLFRGLLPNAMRRQPPAVGT